MRDVTKADKIRKLFDKELDIDLLSDSIEGTEIESIKIFQRLFVEVLNFDVVTGTAGGIAEEISTDDWSKSSRSKNAYIIAESRDFRIFYINLERLTRTAERYTVSSMRAKGWAREKEFISIFHSDGSDVWHLVSPHIEEGEGRTILRRYVIGKGETHRTVSQNLSEMDASRPETLYERVQDAFKLKPITKKFYEDYKDCYKKVDDHFREKGMDIRYSKRYSHLLLNRLMFLYFIQKKKWLNEDKNFISWYLKEYGESNDSECFHQKWLNTLFFNAMNDKSIDADFPDNVKEVLDNFPYLNGGLFSKKEFEEEKNLPDDIYLEDSLSIFIIKGFLENYNFTVTEESPFDRDVAVDPAMLGKIYESLIAEEERGKSGIFYTPREEVDLMCRLALYEYLLKKANDPNKEERKKIVHFLFKPLDEWENKEEDFSNLMNILHNAKVVDPACGSGAFLVGMMQVFTELYRKLGNEPDYVFREQIIHENLHGADIKDWAIRMAEFRLWLGLVEGERDLPDVEPILPNFSFKLKTGDSIVQKVGEQHFSLGELMTNAKGNIVKILDDLRELKREYFEGKSELEEDIEKMQKKLIKKHLENNLKKLKSKKTNNQVTLSGKITKEAKKDKKNLVIEISEIKKILKNINNSGKKSFFWDIDFPEIMLNGGFDIVIGNPPYIDHKKIINQDLDPEVLKNYDDDKIDYLRNRYRQELKEYVKNCYKITPSKKCDLLVYFYYKGFELLKENGVLVFITSNTWLDVKFGRYPQELFLEHGNLKYVLNNIQENLFEESDVHTVISLIIKEHDKLLSDHVDFINLKCRFSKYIDPQKIHDLFETFDNEYCVNLRGENLDIMNDNSKRIVRVSEDSLWRLGKGKISKKYINLDNERLKKEISLPEGKYYGFRWGGNFFMAPDVYFSILKKNENKLKPLMELVDKKINRGYSTGADKFFYIKKCDIDNYDINPKYLKPLLRTPRGLKDRILDENNIRNFVFVCHDNKDELDDSTLDYITWGEEQGFNNNKSVIGVDGRWYDIGKHKEANLFWQKTHYSKHCCYFSDKTLHYNQSFYRVVSSDNEKFFWALLNSSFFVLIKLLYCRRVSGRSVTSAVYGFENYPMIDPDYITDNMKQEIIDAALELSDKKTESIIDEIKWPERQKLDKLVFEILSINNTEKYEIYDSIKNMISVMLEKDSKR